MFLLQVTDWGADGKAETANENSFSTPLTPRTGQSPLTGFSASNLQEFEFNVDNYLGAAYWEASKFLDRLQQVN